MNDETAASPRGDAAHRKMDRSIGERAVLPKSPVVRAPQASTVSMEEVADRENLMRAYQKVASNRGAPGPDRQTIDEVRKHVAAVVESLRIALLEGTYGPGDVRRVWIPKSGGGMRGLGIPNVIDRIVQQALHQVLSPLYDASFHGSSHGFRPGRSCQTALSEARGYIREGRSWVVDIDLEKFFDTVPHDRLMSRLGERIEDARILGVIRAFLRARVVLPNGVVMSVDEGAPQGGPLSPLLSNIVLDELDRELARRGHRFVRYADDCNIYVRSRRAAERAMASVTHFIESRLRLKVNRDKSAAAIPSERHFLGFSLGKVHVDVSTRTERRLREKVRELTPRTWGLSVSTCIAGINTYARGWVGYYGIGTRLGRLLRWADAHLRRRLRAILWTQWKKRITKVRQLMLLGVPRPLACATAQGGGRRCWDRSRAKGVVRALTNSHFEERGLLSFQALWKAHKLKQTVVASAT